MSLGKNIKLMRKNAGWKKSELAEKCRVSKEIVSEWEKDKREPSVREYKSLSKLFDVTIDKLIQNFFHRFLGVMRVCETFSVN